MATINRIQNRLSCFFGLEGKCIAKSKNGTRIYRRVDSEGVEVTRSFLGNFDAFKTIKKHKPIERDYMEGTTQLVVARNHQTGDVVEIDHLRNAVMAKGERVFSGEISEDVEGYKVMLPGVPVSGKYDVTRIWRSTKEPQAMCGYTSVRGNGFLAESRSYNGDVGSQPRVHISARAVES